MYMTRRATRSRAEEQEALQSRRWIFYYDGNCGFCTRVVHGLARADPFHRVQWIPFQSLEEPPQGLSWEDLDRSAYLDTKRGTLHEGFYSFRMLTLGLLPLVPLAPVFWFPGMNLLGTSVYRWIARNRHRHSRCQVPRPRFGRQRKGLGSGEHQATDHPPDVPEVSC